MLRHLAKAIQNHFLMANEQNAPARFGPSDSSLDPARGIPLYVQLANLFRYKILSGAWPEHYRLDKFETLAAQFKVARITVRQAVALLVQEGLLSTQRARGTIVCAPAAAADLARPGQAAPSRFGQGREIQIEVLYKAKVAQLPQEFRTEFDVFESYVEITKVHRMHGAPFGMMRIFIAEPIFRQFPRRAIEKSAILALIFEHAPEQSKHVHQVLTVEVADFILAERLNYPFGSPVGKILRQSYGDDRRLSYAGISWYRGDSFEMNMTLPRTLLMEEIPSPRSLVAPRMRPANVE